MLLGACVVLCCMIHYITALDYVILHQVTNTPDPHSSRAVGEGPDEALHGSVGPDTPSEAHGVW